MKITSTKTLQTENASFTKDEMKCTAFIPELGLITCDTPDYHRQARFLEKKDLVQQLAYMYGDERYGEDFWRAFRKEILAVAGAAKLQQALSSN